MPTCCAGVCALRRPCWSKAAASPTRASPAASTVPAISAGCSSASSGSCPRHCGATQRRGTRSRKNRQETASAGPAAITKLAFLTSLQDCRMFRTVFATLLALASATAVASDQDAVAALDTKYQAAVKRNDADAMARILAPDFVLELGDGSTYKTADLLDEARSGRIAYEQQDEEPGSRTVRVWGDTAVVTAKLWVKYTAGGK